MKRLKNEPELRRSLAKKGLETIRARHTAATGPMNFWASWSGSPRPRP
jgi:spore maturation protein CgeB